MSGRGDVVVGASGASLVAVCVLGMTNREYRIYVVEEIHPQGCGCVAGRESTDPKQGIKETVHSPKDEAAPQPTTPRTIVVSVVPDTLHIASIALALFRSSSTPSNPVCRSLSKIICIPSLLLPS